MNITTHRKVLLLLLGCAAIGCIVQAGSALVIAASDSPADSKAQADYICDGTADQVEIQRALDALGGAGGTVTLTRGTFRLNDYLHIPGNAVLEGQGPDATRLEWSSGFILCDEDQIVLRDFTTTGTGAIWLRGISHAKIHNVVATIDDSYGGAAFTLWAQDSIVEDVEFVNCKAIDCGRHGWMNDGAGSPKLIRNVRYIDCEAINCGRYSRFDHWTTGFDFAELADIEDIEVIGCYAEGNWESGFHFEGAPSKKRVTLRDCVSKNNGQKPDDYYNDNTATYGCLFGAGFWLHGDVTLTNCIAENNRKYGYAVWSSSSHTNLYNCADTGSETGYRLVETDNVYLENCISTDAGKYGVLAANAGQITTKGLVIITPKGDGSVSNIFGSSSGAPVRESSFDIDTYGGEGTAVLCQNGQNVQFSGTVRSNVARPVSVSGSVDTSRLSTQPYSGAAPSPGTPTPTSTPTPTPTSTPTPTPTPTATPAGRPDLVVTDVSWEPMSPVSGSAVTFSATVKNQGDAATPVGTKHGVLFTFDDGAAGPGVWSDTHTASLAPGASVTLTTNGGLAGATWTAVEGTHTVKANVDDVDRITESDETNNVRTEQIVVSKAGPAPIPTPTPVPTTPAPSGKPDLVVTDISWSPANPAIGSAVTFKATVKNQGDAATPAGIISGVAFLVDDRLVVWSDDHTSAIAPGEWVIVTANGGPSGSAVWKATSGAYTVQAWVDDVNRIAESDENNNVMSKEIAVGTQTAPIKGDLNGDGSIDWADVTIVAEMAEGKIIPTTAADLNGDGTVNWEDVALLFDFFFGRTSSL